MFGSSRKPFSAVTVHIERLTTEDYDENDVSGIPELIEAIKLQDSGPSEASRAIRKKLKYGNVHRQLRALTILDALIGNAGIRFQRSCADEPLLERLRVAATDTMTDPDVKAKIKVLFGQWAREYKDTQGLTGIANLNKQLPQRKRARPQPQVLRETSPDPERATSPDHQASRSGRAPTSPKVPTSPKQSPITIGPSADLTSSSKTHKKSSSKTKNKASEFNLEKEKPALLQSLANSSVASTNLKNSLKLINREKDRPSENAEVLKRFETCRQLRRSILRFIQHVESEQWLGGLIHANEELVEALTLYEVLNKPIEEDSDSEEEDWNSPPDRNIDEVSSGMGKVRMRGQGDEDRPPLPNTPVSTSAKGKGTDYSHPSEPEGEEEEDPDDPFGDNQYRMEETSSTEPSGPKWRVV
ncbi:unnamed protein product [Tuber melanosporum]|uniref:(Perigord truffle) hypothetical protein n=1 Tax=Tuber melanosporum (strain Mel28) TaxID=656061 RepID=D5GCW6_TUBMM|nr:uncharacterized protein GSTUM_00000810001 [Tuber melanosporum]CAZ82359.1 unnamed protein product [Tuber melanosporum]